MTDKPIDPYLDDLYADNPPQTSSPATKNSFFTPFGIVVTLTAILMIAVVGWGVYQNSLSQLEDGPAPDFDLPLLSGDGNFKLSDYRGQVVVINFWGSWCIPCREEAPILQETYDLYKDEGVVMVGIAVKDIRSDALDYINELNVSYPNVMDRGARLEDEYRTTGVPETFVINKDGEITKFFLYLPNGVELHAAIEEALNS